MVSGPAQLTRPEPAEGPLPVHWHAHDITSKEVRERRFDVVRHGRTVPGMLWTPEAAEGRRPLVLVGHGAAQTKTEPYVVALARALVRHHAMAALAIDGPVHGDRRPEGPADGSVMMLEFGQLWIDDPALTDHMVGDWRAVMAAVQTLDEVGDGPVGYWGLSMGTIFGVPLLAAEPRISAAVLGLWGLLGPTSDRLASDAGRVSCPILFVVQWDDTLCPRDRGFALFDALATADKRLHANPGAHSAVPADEFLTTARFLADHLGSAGAVAEDASSEQATA